MEAVAVGYMKSQPMPRFAPGKTLDISGVEEEQYLSFIKEIQPVLICISPGKAESSLHSPCPHQFVSAWLNSEIVPQTSHT